MPDDQPRTVEGEALTGLILDLFRLNSMLLTAGDRLVGHLGLTSARWQVLGAMVESADPQTVSGLARDLIANRQNIQRIVNDLEREGLVAFESNPNHKRAQLVVLTREGKKTLEAAMRLQIPWVNHLAEGLSPREIQTFHRVALKLRANLESV